MPEIIPLSKIGYHSEVGRLLKACILLAISSLSLSGQDVDYLISKSKGLQPKLLSTNLVIIDNSTGFPEQELAFDALRVAADSLGQTFEFLTIFQGMYLHLGSQPEELRSSIQEYNLANLTGIDPGRPSIALFTRPAVEEGIFVLEDRIDWSSSPLFDPISVNKRKIIQELAREAANNILLDGNSNTIRAAEVYINTILVQLREPPRHYFYIDENFYGPEDTLYISISNESFPVQVFTEEARQANDLSKSVKDFQFMLNNAAKRIINEDADSTSLRPKSASNNLDGYLIKAEFKIGENKELAATRVIVVDIDFKQEIKKAASPFDDNEIGHYPTYANSNRGNRSRYKYLAGEQQDEIEVLVKPQDIDIERINLSRGTTPILLQEENGKHFMPLTGTISNSSPVNAQFDGELVRRLNIRTLAMRDLQVAFIVLHARITRKNGTTRVIRTRSLSENRANRYISKANEILNKIGLNLVLANGVSIQEDTMDNNNDVIDYNLRTGEVNLEELNRILALERVENLRSMGILPVVFVEKLSNNRIAGTTESGQPQGPLGISFTGRFLSILSQTAPAGINIDEGRNLAHEIGHSYLNLRHPFQMFNGFNQGDDQYNLMDYNHDKTQRYFRAYQFTTINFFNVHNN